MKISSNPHDLLPSEFVTELEEILVQSLIDFRENVDGAPIGERFPPYYSVPMEMEWGNILKSLGCIFHKEESSIDEINLIGSVKNIIRRRIIDGKAFVLAQHPLYPLNDWRNTKIFRHFILIPEDLALKITTLKYIPLVAECVVTN